MSVLEVLISLTEQITPDVWWQPLLYWKFVSRVPGELLFFLRQWGGRGRIGSLSPPLPIMLKAIVFLFCHCASF